MRYAATTQMEVERPQTLRPVLGTSALQPELALLNAGRLKIRFLDGIEATDRNLILASGSYRKFPSTTAVTNQGDPAERMFLLAKGSARHFFITPEGRRVYLQWLVAGEVFGAMALLPKPSLFIVSTEVAKDSRVLVWQRDRIRALAERYPRLLDNGLTIASDYLSWYVASHLSLICDDARRRLAHVLISLSSGLGQPCADGVLLEITNEQLANTANITVFTVSRLVNEWQRKGVLSKRRGSIVLRSMARLL